MKKRKSNLKIIKPHIIVDYNEFHDVEKLLGSGRAKTKESLVVIDLEDDDEDTLKLRLKAIKGLYEIDQVYVDYSEDSEMIVNIIEPISSTYNEK